jgi:hypothetical protein
MLKRIFGSKAEEVIERRKKLSNKGLIRYD